MDKRIHALLIGLVCLDTILVTWIVLFPDQWSLAFHGTPADDPQRLMLRMGANWAGFLLFQCIAVLRWRREPIWLLVVAGLRLSDIFTDASHVFLCNDTTWFAWATLPLMGGLNLAMGLWLLHCGRERLVVRVGAS